MKLFTRFLNANKKRYLSPIMDVKEFACRCTCGMIKICFRVHRFVIKLNLESLHSFDEDYVLQLPLDCLKKKQTLTWATLSKEEVGIPSMAENWEPLDAWNAQ